MAAPSPTIGAVARCRGALVTCPMRLPTLKDADMPEISPEHKERLARLMGLVQKTTILAMSMPEAEREAYLQRRAIEYESDALSVGASPDLARGWSANMDSWVRSTVAIVRDPGGRG